MHTSLFAQVIWVIFILFVSIGAFMIVLAVLDIFTR